MGRKCHYYQLYELFIKNECKSFKKYESIKDSERSFESIGCVGCTCSKLILRIKDSALVKTKTEEWGDFKNNVKCWCVSRLTMQADIVPECFLIRKCA